MVIDSHQHFWHYESEKHFWIDDSKAVIRRDFMPFDLEKVYNENNVDGCVAVQADQTLAETDFLLKLAQDNKFIKTKRIIMEPYEVPQKTGYWLNHNNVEKKFFKQTKMYLKKYKRKIRIVHHQMVKSSFNGIRINCASSYSYGVVHILLNDLIF